MPIDAMNTVGALPRLQPLAPASPTADTQPAAPFAGVLNNVLANNAQAHANAEAAVRDLAAGNTQDLHTVSLAVTQADLSFRLILELRNRITEAFQEVTRMQV